MGFRDYQHYVLDYDLFCIISALCSENLAPTRSECFKNLSAQLFTQDSYQRAKSKEGGKEII
jgi:hypothetical protein